MPKIRDLTGQQFNRWAVLQRDKNKHSSKGTYWLCRCSCQDSTVKSVRSSDLINGKNKSCGCLHKELHSKHGLSRSRINQIYRDMKSRCYNKKM